MFAVGELRIQALKVEALCLWQKDFGLAGAVLKKAERDSNLGLVYSTIWYFS